MTIQLAFTMLSTNSSTWWHLCKPCEMCVCVSRAAGGIVGIVVACTLAVAAIAGFSYKFYSRRQSYERYYSSRGVYSL